MSELIAPQQQLAAAINQLSAGSSSLRISAEAVDIVVRQLTNNQLVIANGNREFTLPRQQLTGNLRANQVYQTIITQDVTPSRLNAPSSQTLRFFSPSRLSLDIPLNNVQNQAFIDSLPGAAQRQIVNSASLLNARVLQNNTGLLTLELDNPNNQPNSIQNNRLALPIPKTSLGLVPNQTIQLRLNSEHNNLGVIIQTARQAFQHLPLTTLNNGTLSERIPNSDTATGVISRFIQRPVNTSLQDIVPALRSAITDSQTDEHGSLHSRNNRQTSHSNHSGVSSNTNPSITARLSFNDRGISITATADIEQATFDRITPQQTRQLSALSIPFRRIDAHQSSAANSTTELNAPNRQAPVANDILATTPATDETSSESFLRQILSSGHRENVLTQVQSLVRQTRPLTESPSTIIKRLETALSDTEISRSEETEKVTKAIKAQLTQSLPGNGTESTEVIRQLLSAAPVNTTHSLISPRQSSNSLINGLIGLLQITLASRLNQANTKTLERITQALSPVLAPGVAAKNARSQVSRSLNDIAQLDQKHLILRELNKFFAGHQNYKLSSIEQQLNSQEGLYYVLPSSVGEQSRDIELLIKRQQEKDASEEKASPKDRAWQVSMKLDIGDKGQILAKARLKATEVELDFYTSTNALTSLVYDFIPYLKTRLQSLGIQMIKHHCQLGKIPQSLQKRPYNILETRV